MPVYTKLTQEEWEAALLQEIQRYTVSIWETAGKPAGVYIAVDGVVPMAKIKQQRLRRFKSIWWAAAEREAGVRKPGEETWDTNSITPGTAFMEKLTVSLRSLAKTRGKGRWIVSGAEEPGEGEQKLMAWMRSRPAAELAGKKVAVYGLDADLIVLSLAAVAGHGAQVASWSLLREGTEFGGGGAAAEGTFATLQIRELLGLLVPPGMTAAEYLQEYICAMCFLGNDFLPHSLSIKIRDGGHDELCRRLADLHTRGARLVVDGIVQLGSCAKMLSAWSAADESMLVDAITHKYKMKPMTPRNDTERLMMRTQNLPLEWREEQCLMMPGGGGLVEDWKEIYRRRWLKEADLDVACAEYWKGVQWVVDYYTGKPVSMTWCYPWNLPPAWSELRNWILKSEVATMAAPEVSSPVAPQEQLAMVLPLESWGLVRDAALRGAPNVAPQFWPKRFGFFSAGRRWMWECEAEIPILHADRLRRMLRR